MSDPLEKKEVDVLYKLLQSLVKQNPGFQTGSWLSALFTAFIACARNEGWSYEEVCENVQTALEFYKLEFEEETKEQEKRPL